MRQVRAVSHTILGIVVALALLGASAAPKGPDGVGTLVGRVTRAGKPVLHADVVLLGTRRSTMTDARGAYRLAGVPVGRFALKIFAEGCESMVRRIEVRPHAVDTVVFNLLCPPRKSARRR